MRHILAFAHLCLLRLGLCSDQLHLDKQHACEYGVLTTRLQDIMFSLSKRTGIQKTYLELVLHAANILNQFC